VEPTEQKLIFNSVICRSARGLAANVSANHAVVFAAMKARRSALVNDQFRAREGAIPTCGKNNGAAVISIC